MNTPPRCQGTARCHDRDGLLDILMSQTIGSGDTGCFVDLLEAEFNEGGWQGLPGSALAETRSARRPSR